jgi:hypothetical protein
MMARNEGAIEVKELLKKNQYGKAAALCEEFLAQNPESFELNVFAGKAAFELGHLDQVRWEVVRSG